MAAILCRCRNAAQHPIELKIQKASIEGIPLGGFYIGIFGNNLSITYL
jgi:hypothetical protein